VHPSRSRPALFPRWLPGVLISLAVVVVLVFNVDWSAVGRAFQTVDWRFLLLHALFYFASVSARAAASRVLLDRRPTFGASFLALMEGYLINNLLPFRLGELSRAYFLSKRLKTSIFYTLPAIVIERAYDLAFAAILVVVTLPFVLGNVSWARPAAFWTLSLVVLALFSMYLVARVRRPLRTGLSRLLARSPRLSSLLLPRLDSFLDGLAILTDFRRFLLSLLWMALSWLAIAACQFALLRGFLPEARPLYAAFALGISSFGGAIPSAPSGLGVYEGAIVVALATFGIADGLALAYAITHHIVHLLYSGIFGLVGLGQEGESLAAVYHRFSRRSAASNVPIEQADAGADADDRAAGARAE